MSGQPIAIGQRETMFNPCMNNYATADGRRFWIVGLEVDRHWPPLCRASARPSGWTTRGSPMRDPAAINAVELIGELDQIFATRTLDEWAEIFAGEPDFFWSPVNTIEDVIADEQFHAAGGMVDVPDGPGGRCRWSRPRRTSTARRGRRGLARRELGQHTDEVLAELTARRRS